LPSTVAVKGSPAMEIFARWLSSVIAVSSLDGFLLGDT
jgi:hypothetical protein